MTTIPEQARQLLAVQHGGPDIAFPGGRLGWAAAMRAIEAALRTAEQQALERAAKVADDMAVAQDGMRDDALREDNTRAGLIRARCAQTAADIAADIRALIPTIQENQP